MMKNDTANPEISIVVVDDHDVVRLGILRILSDERDFKVIKQCRNTRELMAFIDEKKHIDVILLDITMPGASGLDVIPSIKQLRPDIKILIVSMHPENQYVLRVIHLEADGYINKAELGDHLIDAIRTVCAGQVYVNKETAQHIFTHMRQKIDKEPHQTLTSREYEIFMLLVQGKECQEIADMLFVSEKTVRTHRTHVLEKISVKNDVELTHYAMRNGLI